MDTPPDKQTTKVHITPWWLIRFTFQRWIKYLVTLPAWLIFWSAQIAFYKHSRLRIGKITFWGPAKFLDACKQSIARLQEIDPELWSRLIHEKRITFYCGKENGLNFFEENYFLKRLPNPSTSIFDMRLFQIQYGDWTRQKPDIGVLIRVVRYKHFSVMYSEKQPLAIQSPKGFFAPIFFMLPAKTNFFAPLYIEIISRKSKAQTAAWLAKHQFPQAYVNWLSGKKSSN